MHHPLRIGLVLSAGGVRGVYAHTGLLQALTEMGVRFSAMAGCSAGAIVGGIYASGTSLADWLSALAGLRQQDFWRPGSLPRSLWRLVRDRGRSFTGIAGHDVPLAFCRRYLSAASFEDCHIPFHAIATCLANGEKVMFSRGELATAMVASACLPLLYQPVRIGDRYYCDGGVIDLGPTDAICCRHHLDVVIVHHVATRLQGFHGVEATGHGWPMVAILDTLIFRNRPWYLGSAPLVFRQCPCGCAALIVVLEPRLPDLSWPRIEGGDEVQRQAFRQARALMTPWFEQLMSNPATLQQHVQQTMRPAGDC